MSLLIFVSHLLANKEGLRLRGAGEGQNIDDIIVKRISSQNYFGIPRGILPNDPEASTATAGGSWPPLAWLNTDLLWTSSGYRTLSSTCIESVYDKLSSMSTEDTNSQQEAVAQQMRDIAEVPAVEIVTTAAVHLMSAAAVKCGLAEGEDANELKDLDETRKLITALAGLVTAGAPEIGSQHAAPLRDGLRSLQLAFREASLIPDQPGKGPGEKYTGPVN